MNGRKILILLLPLLAGLLSCGKPRGWGELYHVTVLADSSDWERAGQAIEELFAPEWIGPQPERILEFIQADGKAPQEILNRRNLLIFRAGPAEGPTGRMLDKLLSADVRDRIQQEEGFLFAREEAFALEQQLVILAAPTALSFLRQTRERAADIRGLFLEHSRRLQHEGLYRRMEQEDLADSLQQVHGWKLRLPVDWFLIQDEEHPRFLRFRRLNPDRWITVHWVEGEDSLRHSEAGLRQVRNGLGRFYNDKEACVPEVGRFGLSRLGERSVQQLEGLWGTDAFIGGGPFLFWSWYDPLAGASGRTYYIDAVVLNPGGDKGPFLHQLRTIASTFRGHVDEFKRED